MDGQRAAGLQEQPGQGRGGAKLARGGSREGVRCDEVAGGNDPVGWILGGGMVSTRFRFTLRLRHTFGVRVGDGWMSYRAREKALKASVLAGAQMPRG